MTANQAANEVTVEIEQSLSVAVTKPDDVTMPNLLSALSDTYCVRSGRLCTVVDASTTRRGRSLSATARSFNVTRALAGSDSLAAPSIDTSVLAGHLGYSNTSALSLGATLVGNKASLVATQIESSAAATGLVGAANALTTALSTALNINGIEVLEAPVTLTPPMPPPSTPSPPPPIDSTSGLGANSEGGGISGTMMAVYAVAGVAGILIFIILGIVLVMRHNRAKAAERFAASSQVRISKFTASSGLEKGDLTTRSESSTAGVRPPSEFQSISAGISSTGLAALERARSIKTDKPDGQPSPTSGVKLEETGRRPSFGRLAVRGKRSIKKKATPPASPKASAVDASPLLTSQESPPTPDGARPPPPEPLKLPEAAVPPVAPPKSEAEDAAAAAAVAIYQKAQRESLQAHKQAVAEKPTLQLSRSEGDADPSPGLSSGLLSSISAPPAVSAPAPAADKPKRVTPMLVAGSSPEKPSSGNLSLPRREASSSGGGLSLPRKSLETARQANPSAAARSGISDKSLHVDRV